MKLNLKTIMSRYLFVELLWPFIINIAFFTFVFLMAQILDITNLIVNYNISFLAVFKMLSYSMPGFLQLVIPMSVMMAVLLTMIRMSNDNEIMALKACGIGIHQILPPILLFCIIGMILTFIMTAYAGPTGRWKARQIAEDVLTSNVGVGIKERTFNDNFKDIVFFVNEIDPKDKTLIDVFINDQRNKAITITVVAPKGRLYRGENEKTYILRLFNGVINQVGLKDKSAHAVSFDTYDFALDLRKHKTSKKFTKDKAMKELTPGELSKITAIITPDNRLYYQAFIQFHRKFSLPFACIALGLLALPLGIQAHHVKRSFSLGFALLFFIFYYILLSAGMVFSESGQVPVVPAMWMPNIILGSIAIYLIYRKANDEPLLVDTLMERIRNLFTRPE